MWPFPPPPIEKTIKSAAKAVKDVPKDSYRKYEWECAYPYLCSCSLCLEEKRAENEIKALEEQTAREIQEQTENLEFGLHFKPWKEIEGNLPNPPSGYHWEMSLKQASSTAKYFDWTGTEFIQWDDSNRAKDTYIIVKLMYGNKEKFTRRINITGKDKRSEYTDFYKNSIRSVSWIDIVTNTIKWAEGMVDSIQIDITPITKRIG